MRFSATAYAIDGLTASGTRARKGIVAADPKVLPLGSRIRVSNAGAYSGEYLVEDTGPAIKGREIDIKVGTASEARKFGRRSVEVEVLRRGDEDAEASVD
jgi:3D (Asp-Asp-Asp) domain-containing protein